MKPTLTGDVDPGSIAGPIHELSVALRSGRLVKLLKGEGLNRSTVDELLRPESLAALRPILTDNVFPASDRDTREDGRTPVDEDA